MVFTIDNPIYHARISKKLMWWRSGPKGTIYTRPDESPFFCPPTKIWLRVVTTTSLGFDSIFCSSTFICNDSFHHFWLVVDEYLPAFFLHCALRNRIINGENHNFWKSTFLALLAFKIWFWSSKTYFSKMMFRSP